MTKAVLTVLGSAGASGIPKPGCRKGACASKDPKDKRLRFGVLLKIAGKMLMFDAGPDLRQHQLNNGFLVKDVDAVFMTHSHGDHADGMNELSYIPIKAETPFVTHPRTFRDVRWHHRNLFDRRKLQFVSLKPGQTISVGRNVRVTAFKLNHYKCYCQGYRVQAGKQVVVIATDTNTVLSKQTKRLMQNADVLVLDGMAQDLRAIQTAKRVSYGNHPPSLKQLADPSTRGHALISEAITLAHELNAKKCILVGFSHHNDPHATLARKVEDNVVKLGYDGMKIRI